VTYFISKIVIITKATDPVHLYSILCKVQFIQFGFIEETLQIPFLAVCGLVWTFIISLFAGNAKKSYSSENNEITSEDVKAVETLILDEASKTKGDSKSAGKEAMIR
jgi:hypothetical protein